MIDDSQQLLLRQKFNPDGSDLRKAQLRMLELLIFLDGVCRENKLTYWLDSGTLIGAARHGGFIPWDDDIDVCMMRKDAYHLKKILGNKIYNDHIILQTQTNDRLYLNSSWMTLRDLNSEYVQDSKFHNNLKYKGVQVDIFIVDEGIYPRLKRLTSAFQGRFVYLPLFGRNSRLYQTIAIFNHKLLNHLISPLFRLVKNKDIYDIGYGALYSNPVQKDVIFPTTYMSFEGHFFSVPAKTDDYLTNFYGTWKKIPKIDDIKTHNVSFIFHK